MICKYNHIGRDLLNRLTIYKYNHIGRDFLIIVNIWYSKYLIPYIYFLVMEFCSPGKIPEPSKLR